MQRFHFSSSGILLITADSSAPANQNHRIFTIKHGPDKSLYSSLWNFTSQASIFCTVLNIVFQAPTELSTELLTQNGSSSPKFQSPSTVLPKTWSGCHRNTPLLVPICLSQGFYSCTNIMTKKQVGEERVYWAYTSALLFITKGSQDSSRSGSRANAEAMEGCFLLACFP